MNGAYLGPAFSTDQSAETLEGAGAVFDIIDDDEVITSAAEALAEGKAVGWMQGRMEFGPRVLGGRSILSDPRSPSMQKILNLKVKYRQSFRPFPPSVLFEDVSDWFEFDEPSSYIFLVADVVSDRREAMTADEEALLGIEKLNVPRSQIPPITHVDYSARMQTVHEATNPRYWRPIKAFKQRTGCPVVVNTSFNVRGNQWSAHPKMRFAVSWAPRSSSLS